jgi:inosine-uridine nucleoside N-ribohydrolase
VFIFFNSHPARLFCKEKLLRLGDGLVAGITKNRRCAISLKFCATVLVIAFVWSSAEARTIWIDTDPSIGSPIREVDDAYALILALHCRNLEIAGISTSYGNAPISRTTSAARDLISRFGASARLNSRDVFAGARSKSDLGRETPATRALASASQGKQKITYVALGPLTNLATLLILHPNLADRIERIIFVGGKSEGTELRLSPRAPFRIHDANVFKDPAAVVRVLQSKVPIFLVPVETSSRFVLDAAALRELQRSGPAGDYLARHSRFWLWFSTRIARARGGPLFDALAVVAATRPELLSAETRDATVDQSGNLIAARRPRKRSRSVRFCTAFAPATNDFVRQRLQTNP